MAEPDREQRNQGAGTFFALSVSTFRCDEVLDFDLFIQSSADGSPVLYREQHLKFTREAHERLREGRVRTIYVLRSQRAALLRYLEENLSAILADPSVPLDEKSHILYFSAQEVVRDILAKPIHARTLSRCESIVENTIQLIFGEERGLTSLLRITSYDYYTYTHSVNVMVYGVALARRVEIGSEDFYLRFGKALLLHDVGKSRIDQAILNNPGKFTPAEWEAMKQHPLHGRDILHELGVSDEVIEDVVVHHHEKLSGSGYPHGLFGKELSDPVRISAVVDIFDALTTRRVYKDAIGTFAALKLMKEEFQQDLDPRYLNGFVQLLGAAA
jgi:HD-GYP domain-containing protein (c-di-GMP phosphodiesterase class II)